jgi:hypothetical protein
MPDSAVHVEGVVKRFRTTTALAGVDGPPCSSAGTQTRSLALVPGTPSSLGGAIAWIAGLLAVCIPLSVWRYRRMT